MRHHPAIFQHDLCRVELSTDLQNQLRSNHFLPTATQCELQILRWRHDDAIVISGVSSGGTRLQHAGQAEWSVFRRLCQ
jgi:hypothetical protein